MNTWKDQLEEACPTITFLQNEPLSHHTTVGIGGPAELFCVVRSKLELVAVLKAAIQLHIPLTILGWGANTLIADRGLTGLVIKNMANAVRILDKPTLMPEYTPITARWKAATADTRMPQFQDIDYDESQEEKVYLEIESGASLPVLIQQLLQQGITGLQWFAKIPATLGGAVVNNIHGGTHYISEYVLSVDIIDNSGNERTLKATELEFAYDFSRFHHSGEHIVSVEMQLYRGDQKKAQQVITDWSRQKQKQPAKSLGCVFQNISNEEQLKLDVPTPSIGYLVDQKLHLSGKMIGGAQISKDHAAFIVNTGSAKASEYLELLKLIHTQVKKMYGISLKPEIFFKGFTSPELDFLETQL